MKGLSVLLSTCLVSTVAAVMPVASSAAPSSAPAPSATSDLVARDAPSEPVRRVVWYDDGTQRQPATIVRSARRDGSDAQVLYRGRASTLTSLTVSREGDRVAFDPFDYVRPRIIIAPTNGGEHENILPKNPNIDAIGGIGWAPGGRRLVFEATRIRRDGAVDEALWTIRDDGAKLRRLTITAPDIDGEDGGRGGSNRVLAWTDRGILYSDGTDLKAFKAGRATTLIRRVDQVAVSGDGTVLALRRGTPSNGPEFWTAAADGTGLRKHGSSTVEGQYVGPAMPSYHGTRFLDTGTRPPDDDSPFGSNRVDLIDDQVPSTRIRTLDFMGESLVFGIT